VTPGRRPAVADLAHPAGRQRLLRLGLATAVVAMVATSTGDILVVSVALGLLAADAVVGATAVLVGLATVARWSSSSLGALAGGQAVVGAAGWTGSWPSVLSSWAAAVALVLVCPAGRAPPVAFGVVAGAVVVGPAVGGSMGNLAVRLAVSAAAVGAAALLARQAPRRLVRPLGLEMAALALLVVLAPQP
jgi:hypothetical protein